MARNRVKDPTEEMYEADEREAEEKARRNKLIATGVGVGIGSAALVAALLYANRARKKKVDAAEE